MPFTNCARLVLGGLFFSTTSLPAFAAERIGPSYGIGEEDAAKAIVRKLKEKERSGELQAIQKAAYDRTLRTIKTPKALPNITTATKYRANYIDPSVSYASDVKDDLGNVIIKAGTRLNPLEVMPLTKVLLFFNGADPAQVLAAKNYMATSKTAVKPILVAGSWFELTKAWKTQVYHDQQGELTRRFNIATVPALVRQQGNRLLLEEVPARSLKP